VYPLSCTLWYTRSHAPFSQECAPLRGLEQGYESPATRSGVWGPSDHVPHVNTFLHHFSQECGGLGGQEQGLREAQNGENNRQKGVKLTKSVTLWPGLGLKHRGSRCPVTRSGAWGYPHRCCCFAPFCRE